jgi:hypothetical protein
MQLAVVHDGPDFRRIPNIGKRISGQDDQTLLPGNGSRPNHLLILGPRHQFRRHGLASPG